VRIGKHTRIALLLLGAFGAPGLSAQEGYSYAFKARGGLLAGDLQATHFDNKVLGFGAEVRREMFGGGRGLTLEVAWEYVPGRNYSVMKPVNGDAMDIFSNFDARKEYGQGFSYKAAYNAPLRPFSWVPPGIEWFGGLSLDMHSVRTEIEFTLFHPSAPGSWPAGTADGAKYQGDSFVEQGTAMSPGLFGGLRLRLSEGTALELALRNFGMRHHDFTPGIYFGSAAGKMESGTSRGWSLEFALAMKI
jgi:hypothetical protein